MNWTEVNIYTTTEGTEPLSGRLLGLGINGFVIKDAKDFEDFLSDKSANWDYIDDDLMGLRDCETCVTVYLPENSQGADCLAAIRSELSAMKSLDTDGAFGRLEIELANVREEDWANNWKQYFKPIAVGERLLIKPSWESCEGYEDRTILEIDPASSFGTGQHNTTRICLELLEKYMKSGDRVLDLGCGSGILSIAAMLLGAERVSAIDIDSNAVRIAGENAAKNNIPPEKYTLYCGNVIGDDNLADKMGSGYDVIVANIVADVLIAMSDRFVQFIRSGGTLIISGIITERRHEVCDVVNSKGFTEIAAEERDGWAAVAFVKN